MVWRYKRHYTDKTLKLRGKTPMNMASERSEASLENFHISHSKTAISFNIFVGTSDTLSQKHLLSGLI